MLLTYTPFPLSKKLANQVKKQRENNKNKKYLQGQLSKYKKKTRKNYKHSKRKKNTCSYLKSNMDYKHLHTVTTV